MATARSQPAGLAAPNASRGSPPKYSGVDALGAGAVLVSIVGLTAAVYLLLKPGLPTAAVNGRPIYEPTRSQLDGALRLRPSPAVNGHAVDRRVDVVWPPSSVTGHAVDRHVDTTAAIQDVSRQP
jgi:hypothetical protein